MPGCKPEPLIGQARVNRAPPPFCPCEVARFTRTNDPFSMQTKEISLDLINIYGGTQTRVQTTDEAVESYADEMTRGTVFPPIDVYFDGATYWLSGSYP